jgi:hypothetical protein
MRIILVGSNETIGSHMEADWEKHHEVICASSKNFGMGLIITIL